jgi:hypothetical protein
MAENLLGPKGAEFQARYKFNLSPATDDRPYFSRFLKPATLMELFSLKGSGGLGMLSLAEPVLAATLVQAVILSLLAIWLPLRRFGANRTAGGAHAAGPPGRLYFLLGAGFMLAEFAIMEKMRLFLNAPVLAAGVTLGGFLALAGVGGGLSTRFLAAGRPALALVRPALVTILGLLLLYLAALPPLLSRLLGLSLGLRLALAPLIIAPLALPMGLPFPLALAALKERQRAAIPWAWGLNGCGALVGPVVGMGLAVYAGVSFVLGAAAVCYGGAALSLSRGRIDRPGGGPSGG